MPPLSASKFLAALCTTDSFPDEHGNLRDADGPIRMLRVDIKRAHFVSPATRDIAVELPPELQKEGTDEVGYLLKSMYGTRDAAANWEREIARVLTSLGFTQGRSSPCVFYQPQRQIRLVVHGDDFTSVAALKHLQWLSSEFCKVWMSEIKGILGPPGTLGTVQTIRYLNRILTWDEHGILWEPDPRHVDRIVEAVGVSASSVTTPLRQGED